MAPHMERIDAVFASNDRMAIGLIQGLREHGFQPGRDYAIIGYDDSDAARVTDPPLSSVAVPFFEMGRIAAEQVIGRLNADDNVRMKPIGVKLDTRLVVRRSCRLEGTRF